MEKIRSGGVYCSNCKKCICQPRLRKNYQKESWIICEECNVTEVLRMTFRPTEDSLITDFYIKYKDIPMLINELIRAMKKLEEKC